MLLTNFGFTQRVVLLADQNRWFGLLGFLAVWAFSLGALAFTMLVPQTSVRVLIAALIAVSSAAGVLFQRIAGSDLSLLDVMSLWSARHEASRAADMYTGDAAVALALMAAVFMVLALPAPDLGRRARWWTARLCWAPLTPLILLSALAWNGRGAQLPSQYAPLSVALVAGVKMAQAPIPRRGEVDLPRDAAVSEPKGNVVVLVDESVRADYVGAVLDHHADRLVDFGPAASGGVCSHYSNALLRFMAAPATVGRRLLSNPTVWQYAKAAGYRTVFIDAQSKFNKSSSKLQNFMTTDEARLIDQVYAADQDQPAPDLDFWLLDIVKKELAGATPVFIYANKNGAHIPYDRGYPEDWRVLRPTMGEAGPGSIEARINSYRNVMAWSVEHFFDRLFVELNGERATLIYTSDHGQVLRPDRLTHCSVSDPDPREALAPLFVVPGSAAARADLAAAAAASHGHGSHFQIAPTVLRLLGYDPHSVSARFGPSLFDANPNAPMFTTGDVFNLVSDRIDWHAIDLKADYRERPGLPVARPLTSSPIGPTSIR